MPCTTILVGKKASLNGSTIIARQEDYGQALNPQRFVLVTPDQQPRKYASKTTSFKCTLPDNPLRYTSDPDADPAYGVFGAAGINEANVAMTATETSTTNSRILGIDPYNEESGIGEEDFVTLILPYIHSAREGVQRLGNLLATAGTYESNGIAFSDQNEVWYVETIGGHHWAAIRIPDDCYVIAPNRFNITAFDFNSVDTMASPDLQALIEKYHLNPDKNGYNLRHIFGSTTMQDARYNNPRTWYVQKLFGGAPMTDPTSMDQPFCCHPDHLIAVEEIKKALSSHYQNTVYDPYGGTSGKQFRPIALNRNLELHILEIRSQVPASLAAIHWLAFGPNTFNAVVPFYANVLTTPAPYEKTSQQFDPTNMYWLTNTLAALGDRRYQAVAGKVEAFEQTVVAKCRHRQLQADRQASIQADIPAYLTRVNDEMATISQQAAIKLLGELVKDAFPHEQLSY